MNATQVKTMTQAQMNWNLKRGFAWFGENYDGSVADDWRDPIWTKAGGWLWSPPTSTEPGRYELAIA